MINEQYKYSELTPRIIGCAITVNKTLGNGFQEVKMDIATSNFPNFSNSWSMALGVTSH